MSSEEYGSMFIIIKYTQNTFEKTELKYDQWEIPKAGKLDKDFMKYKQTLNIDWNFSFPY